MLLTDVIATRGFRIQESAGSDTQEPGYSVALAGDINGDGYADFMVHGAQYDGVFLGRAERFDGTLYIEDMDGSDGFRVRPQDGSYVLGAAGDINGDGLADMMFGQPDGGDHGNPTIPPNGLIYVVLGRDDFPPVFENPGGTSSFNNFDLLAPPGDAHIRNYGFGIASFGDMNGDGKDEFAGIGIPNVDWGDGVFARSLSTSDFTLTAVDDDPRAGPPFLYEGNVAGAGDVDADGHDEALMGIVIPDRIHGGSTPGALLVYGQAGSGGDVGDFRTTQFSGLTAPEAEPAGDSRDVYPVLASAGDFNGDGYGDFLIGGALVFGRAAGFGSAFDLTGLDGSDGFRITGVNPRSAAAGDFNGDGFSDLIIGSSTADPGGRDNAGSVFVLYGRAGIWSASVDITALGADAVLRIDGDTVDQRLGHSVGSGKDIDGDGFDDIIVGAPGLPGSPSPGGAAYVIYGAATGGPSQIVGTEGPDVLVGDAGPNQLLGLGGNDVLRGLGGADMLNGGAGFDYADYSTGTGPVFINLTDGTGQWNDAQGDQLTGIEGVIGTGLNDVLTGDGSANILSGGNGEDHLYGLGGNDTLIGGFGPDLLFGGDGVDTASYAGNYGGVWIDLTTGAGKWNYAEGDVVAVENLIGTDYTDWLFGDHNVNRLEGGLGDDRLSGGMGGDVLDGGGGTDTADYAGNIGGVWIDLSTGVGKWNYAEGDMLIGIENVTGTQYDDRLIGNAGVNVLRGNGGNDTLAGGFGGDLLDGGAGTGDTADYTGNYGGVWIDLSTGVGKWNYAEGDTLTGVENVVGTDWTDWLTGNAGNNRLEGGKGDDRLVGGAGNDVLKGGLGADLLDGGANVDTADYSGNYGGVWINLATGAGKWNYAEGDTLVGIDKVIGTDFTDWFESSGHTDFFTGGGANDLFIFQAGYSEDVITDFTGNGAAAGDTIRFGAGTFTSFADVMSHAVQHGGDVVITLDAHDILTLQNTQLASLNANDFVFG